LRLLVQLLKRVACWFRGSHDVVLVGYLAHARYAECRRCGLRWELEKVETC